MSCRSVEIHLGIGFEKLPDNAPFMCRHQGRRGASANLRSPTNTWRGTTGPLAGHWKKNERRQATRGENLRLIKGSETRLVETMLRRRSSFQISELHRLCAHFFDNRSARDAEVDRILSDQNIVTMALSAEAPKANCVTTRRIARLVALPPARSSTSGISSRFRIPEQPSCGSRLPPWILRRRYDIC
jgi:hypothetical protein